MSEQHEIHTREFPVEFAAVGDGRTIDARIVPYNISARVSDPPDFTPYEEAFVPGAFERQLNAPNRVNIWLNFEHEQGIRGVIGHGVELQERADGLYGSFRVHDNPDGDKALSLVREGLLTGLSLEFASLRSRVVDGVTQRVRAHIDKVALCRAEKAAYEGAAVLALREGAEDEAWEQDVHRYLGISKDDMVDMPAEQLERVKQTAEEMRRTAESLNEEPEPEPEPEESSAVDETLSRLGYEKLLKRAVVKTTWDGSAARFSDEEYQKSCLIDRGGEAPPKERCSLPVLEPNGDLNVNALGAAASRLSQTQASSEQKSAAARKLMRYYGQAGMDPPPSVRQMASR